MSAVNPLPPTQAPDKRGYEPSMEEILASIRRIIADDQSLPGRASFREAEAPSAPNETESHASVPSTASTASTHAVTTRPAIPVSPSAVAMTEPLSVETPVQPPAQPAHDPMFQTASTAGVAHGAISAPQFAMPHGPAGDDIVVEPSAPEPAVEDHEQPVASTPTYREPEARSAPEPVATPDPNDRESEFETTLDPTQDQAPPADGSSLFSTSTHSAVSAAFNMLAASRLADNSDELMTLAREMIRPLLRTWIDDNLPSMVERLIRAEIERVARGGR